MLSPSRRKTLVLLFLFSAFAQARVTRDYCPDVLARSSSRYRRHLQSSRKKVCDGVACSTKGICDELDGTCLCEDGATGADCQLDPKACPNGQLNATGHCCSSGVFDHSGQCCGDSSDKTPRWRLDRHGVCCNTEPNGCGECGGVGFMDAHGSCCKGTLDAGGLCCRSSKIDECGVCDGNGESCVTRIELTLRNNSSESPVECLAQYLPSLIHTPIANVHTLNTSLEWRKFDGLQITVSVNRGNNGKKERAQVAVHGGVFTTHSFEGLLYESLHQYNPCSIAKLNSITKQPVCGNGICEIGEALSADASHTCATDCPFEIAMCKTMQSNAVVGIRGRPCSGNGMCKFAQGGRCVCLRGYTGTACDQCASGFFAFQGLCHQRQSLHLLNDISTNDTSAISTIVEKKQITNRDSPSSGSRDDRTWIIVLAVCCAAGLLLVFAIFVYHVSPKRKQKQQSQPPTEGDLEATSSGSLLAIYLKNFKDFQKRPPWEGSIDKQNVIH